MSRISYYIKQSAYPPPILIPSSLSTPSNGVEIQRGTSPPLSSSGKISPVFLWVIIVLAVIFFTAGLLHLLVRFLLKRPSFSAIYQSNRYSETSGSHAIQRQLQQLFRLHDSGLDQAVVDALPVFCYKDIMGLKEPFDCAVCLCEFSDQDRLRLLPLCSHAFHIDCIDTWLLSNSTCPLCRGSLLNSSFPMENSVFSYDFPREISNGSSNGGENGNPSSHKPNIIEEKRVFSVRLGKFRSINGGEEKHNGERQGGEIGSSSLDQRRCFSMGAFQYVVEDSSLQIALSPCSIFGGRDLRIDKARGREVGCSSDAATDCGDVEEKKIRRIRGESFSVSKIWLWSKKNRFPTSSNLPTDTSLNV